VTALGDLTWTQVDASGLLLAMPLGATEQHGPHLPLSTDTDIAVALTAQLAAALDGVITAPAVPYGASGEHQAFPGTLSIGQEAIELLLMELVRSATNTFSRVLLVSAHGGNAESVARAVRRLRGEGRDVRAWSPAAFWAGDAHAGRVETSLMLALDASRVRRGDCAPGATRPLPKLMPALRSGGVVAVSPNGVLGDPTGASAIEGEALLRAATNELVTATLAWPSGDGAWL
jgi:mycofactocin system creatininase family protein